MGVCIYLYITLIMCSKFVFNDHLSFFNIGMVKKDLFYFIFYCKHMEKVFYLPTAHILFVRHYHP